MGTGNGEKSKVIYFLLGVIQVVVLGWFWKLDGNLSEAKTKIAMLEANYTSIQRTLDEMKGDIKSLVRRPSR